MLNIKWPTWPEWNPTADSYIQKIAHSGRWTIRGAWTGEPCFEERGQKQFANYIGTKYAVFTTSGTMALQLAMEVLHIGEGDEVIVPALTWIAPVVAILNVGAIPRLTDIDINTTCLSIEAVKKNINSRTKAIIAVHLHCCTVDLDAISKIAKEYGLFIVEDCSQAHGAEWRNKKVGGIGDIAAFSFNQEKALPCGEGGAVATNRADLYHKLNCARLDGCDFDSKRQILKEDQLIYDAHYMGQNASISEFQTAVLLSQLELLEERNKIKNKNAALLTNKLKQHPLVKVITPNKLNTKRSYYEYIFFLKLKEHQIDEVCKLLTEQTGVVFHRTDVPVYRNDLFNPESRKQYEYYIKTNAYKELRPSCFPGCEYAYSHIIAFSHYILLATSKEISILANKILEVLDTYV